VPPVGSEPVAASALQALGPQAKSAATAGTQSILPSIPPPLRPLALALIVSAPWHQLGESMGFGFYKKLGEPHCPSRSRRFLGSGARGRDAKSDGRRRATVNKRIDRLCECRSDLLDDLIEWNEPAQRLSNAVLALTPTTKAISWLKPSS
jgi:hypothetical protein